MSRNEQSGFTLIEIILVMAISSSLAVIAFLGQSQLRSQAEFDASINKIVSTINDAKNEATAGVNTVGSGNGLSLVPVAGCGSGISGSTVFRGTSWSFDNTLGSPIKIEYYKSTPNPSPEVCSFQTQSYNLTSQITATSQITGGVSGPNPGGRMLFVRNDTGGLDICPVDDITTDVLPSYQAASCTSNSITFDLIDPDGHKSQVLVDGSGLAKRLN